LLTSTSPLNWRYERNNRKEDPVKIVPVAKFVGGFAIILAGAVMSLSLPANHTCMDPNVNAPINCSLVGR
jgi:hypothetical protein